MSAIQTQNPAVGPGLAGKGVSGNALQPHYTNYSQTLQQMLNQARRLAATGDKRHEAIFLALKRLSSNG